jgi:hypothetical protein
LHRLHEPAAAPWCNGTALNNESVFFMDIVNDILWHSFVLFLWLGSMLAVLVGAGLLFAPTQVDRINRYFAQWIATQNIGVAMDRPRSTERYIYRHHRVAGALVFVGSALVIYRFLLAPARERMALLAAPDMFGLLDAGIGFLVIGNVLAAAIGLMVFFRPSMLREFEDVANRWISTEQATRFFNRPQFLLDQFVLQHRRLFGAGFIVAGLAVCCLLGKLLFSGQWHL